MTPTHKAEKACFSRVGIDYDQDFVITFSDCQNLQLLRQKLLRTASILEACLDVTSGCADHCIRLTSMNFVDSSDRVLSEIEYYKRQLLQHRHTVGRITQQAAEAGRLVSDSSSTFLTSYLISFNNERLARSIAIQDP